MINRYLFTQVGILNERRGRGLGYVTYHMRQEDSDLGWFIKKYFYGNSNHSLLEHFHFNLRTFFFQIYFSYIYVLVYLDASPKRVLKYICMNLIFVHNSIFCSLLFLSSKKVLFQHANSSCIKILMKCKIDVLVSLQPPRQPSFTLFI